MQNHNAKSKNDLKIRAYNLALNTIKFIDSLDKKDLSVEIITK